MKITDLKINFFPYVRLRDAKTASFMIDKETRAIMTPKIMREFAKRLISAADRIDRARAKTKES